MRGALAAHSPGDDGSDLATQPDEPLRALSAVLGTACEGMTPEELTALVRVAERALHDLDRADIHAVTDGSDDGFLYARGFTVALGRE